MSFGLGVLRLPPAQFWAMTLREVAAAADGVAGRGGRAIPPVRADLAALMAAFPDDAAEETSHG